MHTTAEINFYYGAIQSIPWLFHAGSTAAATAAATIAATPRSPSKSFQRHLLVLQKQSWPARPHTETIGRVGRAREAIHAVLGVASATAQSCTASCLLLVRLPPPLPPPPLLLSTTAAAADAAAPAANAAASPSSTPLLLTPLLPPPPPPPLLCLLFWLLLVRLPPPLLPPPPLLLSPPPPPTTLLRLLLTLLPSLKVNAASGAFLCRSIGSEVLGAQQLTHVMHTQSARRCRLVVRRKRA